MNWWSPLSERTIWKSAESPPEGLLWTGWVVGLDGSQDCKCEFGHLDAVQPHGSKKTTWLTVTNMFSLESMYTQTPSSPPWTCEPNRGGKTTHEGTDAIIRVTLCHFYNSPASYKHHRPEDVRGQKYLWRITSASERKKQRSALLMRFADKRKNVEHHRLHPLMFLTAPPSCQLTAIPVTNNPIWRRYSRYVTSPHTVCLESAAIAFGIAH